VAIPTRHAAFDPRPGVVYLPPAALVPDPPALPVVVAMSGQPGSPADMFSSARLPSIADAIARDNNGVAPIIVVPDQLGSPGVNPMCVDSPKGDTETYLTRDLPQWISQNLNVTTDRTGWTIAGFSQGGTCSIQLGAGDPEVFGSIIDVAGERVPSLGDPATTIDVGFGGDESAYVRAQPESILAANAPYPDSVAIFASGENDERYTAYNEVIAASARRAGMEVRSVIAPGSGHDWNTAHFGFEVGFASLVERWGIRK
jgi:S-formylglutathione hydrolase FrmB